MGCIPLRWQRAIQRLQIRLNHPPSSFLSMLILLACKFDVLNAMQALEIMEKLILPGSDKMDVRDPVAVAKRIKGSVCSKQYGYEDLLSPLIAKVIALLTHIWPCTLSYMF